MQQQVEELPLGDSSETDEDIEKRLAKTYRVYEKGVNGIVNGVIRSLIVTGATGCGKSHLADSITIDARDSGAIELRNLSGTSSALGIYRELWQSNQGAADKTKVLVVDDCDVYHDLEAISVLKRALNTSNDKRHISWNKESYPLINNGIPLEFDYEGACLFLTNKNFVKEISYDGKMAPHYKAFLGRSIFLDLGIHSKREILIRIKQVAKSGDFFAQRGIEPQDGRLILNWLTEHLAKLREISFNTVINLHKIMTMDKFDWEETAEVTLWKRS